MRSLIDVGFIPAAVLTIGLGVTAIVTTTYRAGEGRRQQARFDRQVETLKAQLHGRIGLLRATLRGTAGLIATNPDITGQSFRDFVVTQRVGEFLPGTLGIGFTRRVPAGELAAATERMVARFPDFRISPPEPRKEYHVIELIEPLDDRNRVAIGYDMFTDPTRRAAMEKARDTSYAAMSGMVHLVQDVGDSAQPGFLIYRPVYQRNVSIDTPAARAEALLGFAYSPLRAQDFLQPVFAVDPDRLVDVVVFDGTQASAEHELYRSGGDPVADDALSATVPITIAQRTWTLVFTTRPQFHAQESESLTLGIPLAGSIVSVLLAALVAAQVAARRRAERAADLYRVEHERFRTTLSGVDDGVIAVDRDGRVAFLNRVAEQLTGRAADAAIGKPVDEVMRLFDRAGQRTDSGMKPVLAGVSPSVSTDQVMIAGAGETPAVAIDIRIAPLRHEAGHVIGAVVVLRDITAQQAARDSLLESETRKSAILESALDCIITMDARGRIVDFNPAAERTFGHSRADVTGKTVAEIVIPPRLRAAHTAGMRKYFETGDGPVLGKRIEIQALRADGAEFPVELAIVATNLRTPDGRTAAFFTAYLRDLTDRNQARDAVRRSEEQFRAVVEQVADYAIFIVGLDGRAATWNLGVTRVLGYAEAEFVGLDFAALFTPEDVDAGLPASKLAQAQHVGQAISDRWMVRKDGSRFWANGTTTPLRSQNGELIGFTKVLRDQTESKRVEQEREALLANERAARSEVERTSRMKDEFVATLSHELRTPLNAILGWSQILHKSIDDPDDLRTGLETIERNARAQAQMVDDLLDMSRIISGKVRLDIRRVDMAEVVSNAMDSIRPAAEAKGIRLHATLDGRSNVVSGDASRLQQVAWNLLTNAVKFTPKGGQVQVVVKRVESSVRVEVSDTGKGIRPEFLTSVFERFRQEDASITRKYGGLGLGLAIVKHLVELHGGSVQAASPGEGMGATFSFTLPVSATFPQPADTEPSAARPSHLRTGPADSSVLQGVKVLVVDDEPDSFSIIRRVLERAGAEVATADSVAKAQQAFADFAPHILLSDIGMPGRDGYELIKWIRSLPPEQGGRTPAGALTALARSEDRTRALMAGYQVHLAKPIEPAELIAVAVSLAAGRS